MTMTDKEKEIEGMAKVIVNFKEKHDIPLGVGFHSVDLSKHIIKAGYRKADEVRKETIKECSKWLHDNMTFLEGILIDEFDKAFGIEVDKDE